MEVDRQSSPWPTVVMLACLVAFCLTVPRHWRKTAEVADAAVRQESPPTPSFPAAQNAAPSALAFPYFDSDLHRQASGFSGAGTRILASHGRAALDSDLVSLLPVPTIDELVAQRVGITNLDDSSVGWSLGWMTCQPAAEQAEPEGQNVADDAETAVEPLILRAFDRMGGAILTYSPAELLTRLTAQAARAYRIWSTGPVIAGNAEGSAAEMTLRLVRPADRLAMLPQDAEKTPIMEPNEGGLNHQPPTDPWCVPQVLFDQLQRIAAHQFAHQWAETTLADLRLLTERTSLDGDDVQTVLSRLSDSAEEAVRMAEGAPEDRLRVELLRAHWGLARRLDRWAVAHEIRVAALAGERVAARGSLGTYFDGVPGQPAAPEDDLTRQLENYEAARDPQVGRQIVSQKRVLEGSSDALDRALADAVEQHYRNANVRVAVSAAMLNRYVGQERSEVRPLRDRVGGAMIRGQSRLQSSSRVDLEPATGRWELDVESQGTIHSNATADGGQARFRSQTSTDFSARKQIVVDANGVLLQPAKIDVDSHNRLMGVTTDADWIPIFASYARDRAVREYRARQHRAKTEVEEKVAAEAMNTIDNETKKAVERVEKQLRDRVMDRLTEFGVKVTPVELTTTHERVVARLRVASEDQTGSHTPRPRALSDSLVSAQIHETALTNAAISLELDGRQYSAAELVQLFQKKFPSANVRSIDDEKRNTVFQFAKQDALKFHIEDGRFEVTLTLKSVELDGRRMRNFVVHAFYIPSINGLEAELVRDGSLGIEGRLSSGDRARLHNIFDSVLPPERTVPIVNLTDESDPRLAGLMITQLVLEDGWLGLSMGPTSNERVAERSRSLR